MTAETFFVILAYFLLFSVGVATIILLVVLAAILKANKTR